MIQAILIAAAVVQFLFGSLAYVRDTLAGRSRPNRMTMVIWAAGPFIAIAAALSSGGTWALLPVFIKAAWVLSLFFLHHFVNPKAYWQLAR